MKVLTSNNNNKMDIMDIIHLYNAEQQTVLEIEAE